MTSRKLDTAAPAPPPFYDHLQATLQDLMHAESMEESARFAALVQARLDGILGSRNRGVKQAPLVVLLGAKMPSVLAEVSFISNPDDEASLKGEARRQQIADALFEGIQSYFDTLSGFRTAEVRD